jgi:hypothetical protein
VKPGVGEGDGNCQHCHDLPKIAGIEKNFHRGDAEEIRKRQELTTDER